MEEDKYWFSHGEDVDEIIGRFERMRREKENFFFDVADYELIIDYYLDINNVNRADEAADIALSQHPNSVPIRIRKARVFIDRGRAVETLKIIRNIESIEPGNPDVYIIKGTALGMLGDVEGARRMFDKVLAIDKDELENNIFTIAAILQDLNLYEQVILYLQKLSGIDPDEYLHYYDIAFAYDRVGDRIRAIEYYELFLNEEPFSDSAWFNLGIIYNKAGNHDKALEAYDFALAINPHNAFALYNKGNILSQLERYQEAIAAYLEYLEYEPESYEAMIYLAECFERRDDLVRADKYFRMAVDYDAELPDGWFGLGVVCFRRDKFRDALIHFKRSISVDGENAEYYYMFAKALFATGQVKQSVRNLKKAVEIDPFLNDAWIDFGIILHETGSARFANRFFEEAIRIVGDVPGFNYLCAACRLAAGRDEEALKLLVSTINSEPNLFISFSPMFPPGKLSEEVIELIKPL